MALTGMHVPIERSFAMASLVVLGLLLGRRVLSLRGLAVAATALLLLSPEQVVGVSFQMSFAAVLALISGYEAMRPWLRRLRGDGQLRGLAAHASGDAGADQPARRHRRAALRRLRFRPRAALLRGRQHDRGADHRGAGDAGGAGRAAADAGGT